MKKYREMGVIGVSQKSRAASETISLRVQLNGAEFRVKVEDNFTVALLKKRIMSVGARREAEA